MFVAGFAFTPRLPSFPCGSLAGGSAPEETGAGRRVSRLPVVGRIQRNDEVAVSRSRVPRVLPRNHPLRLGRP